MYIIFGGVSNLFFLNQILTSKFLFKYVLIQLNSNLNNNTNLYGRSTLHLLALLNSNSELSSLNDSKFALK